MGWIQGPPEVSSFLRQPSISDTVRSSATLLTPPLNCAVVESKRSLLMRFSVKSSPSSVDSQQEAPETIPRGRVCYSSVALASSLRAPSLCP